MKHFACVSIIESWTKSSLKIDIHCRTSTNYKINYQKQYISSNSILKERTIWYAWRQKKMKNNFSNSIWTLRIHDNVVWAHQCLDNVSRNDQRCITRALKCVCYRVPWRYIDLFQDTKETRTTCKDNVAMFETTTIVI